MKQTHNILCPVMTFLIFLQNCLPLFLYIHHCLNLPLTYNIILYLFYASVKSTNLKKNEVTKL